MVQNAARDTCFRQQLHPLLMQIAISRATAPLSASSMPAPNILIEQRTATATNSPRGTADTSQNPPPRAIGTISAVLGLGGYGLLTHVWLMGSFMPEDQRCALQPAFIPDPSCRK